MKVGHSEKSGFGPLPTNSPPDLMSVFGSKADARDYTPWPVLAQVADVETRFRNVVKNELHIEPGALTAAEASHLLNFRNADAL